MVNGRDSSFMFGDKLLVVNSTVMPAGKLQCRSNVLNCHLTRESHAKGIIKFVHMNLNKNPADIVTKSRAYNTCFPLIKPLIFWLDMVFLKERVVAEGSENRSSTPLISQDKGTLQKSFKLDIRNIRGD